MERDFKLVANCCGWGDAHLAALSGVGFGVLDICRNRGISAEAVAAFVQGERRGVPTTQDSYHEASTEGVLVRGAPVYYTAHGQERFCERMYE